MIIEVIGKEIEKIKGDFESYLNGLNMVGEISYSQYSELYDEGTKQIQRAYELGKTELENKIADIKANCDLAIEGRDIKIKELELELTVEKDQHQEEINLHLHAEDYIKSLEQQIEKMKCCGNCRFSESDTLNGTFCHREGCFVVASAKCKLWEM